MKTAIEDDTFYVGLTDIESIRLGQGEAIRSGRNSPIWNDAQVVVYPYAELDPTFTEVKPMMGSAEWDRRVYQVRTVARFLSNMDLILYVPQEVARFALIAREHIARDNVATIVPAPERIGLLSALPTRGIVLDFSYREDANYRGP